MLASDRIPASWRNLSAAFVLACSPFAAEAMETSASALAEGIDLLRQTVGTWNVTTTQYRDDGTVARKVNGTYQFDWVVPDRVVSGRSSIASLGEMSGILIYVNERCSTLEMAQVDADGQLTVMSGNARSDLRTTAAVTRPDGSKVQLRVTRFNVGPDRFESRLDVSIDGGENWRPGSHQRFVRAMDDGGTAAGLRYRKRSQNYVPLT